MAFVSNAAEVAQAAMGSVNPTLIEKYVTLIRFLSDEPNAASVMRGKGAPAVGSEEYIRRQALNFAGGREPKAPMPPETVPDDMVSFILCNYFDVPEEDLDRAKREHLLSMGAENLVGDLLERYLASILEPLGWIWCSGSMVRAVDLIRPPELSGGKWRLLQVKNRDNSENSSSSAIRVGTAIEKWFRTYSRREGSNWAAFPDITVRCHLSEQAFRDFVKKYLLRLRGLEGA